MVDANSNAVEPILEVRDLSISFRMYERDPQGRSLTGDGEGFRSTHGLLASHELITPIDGLSLTVGRGEMVAIVGASGSGKTLLADAVLGLFEPNELVTGTIRFDGEDQDAESLTALRGTSIAYVPQSIEALDPLQRVGKQVRGAARAKCIVESGQGKRARGMVRGEWQHGRIPRRTQNAERAHRQRELFERYGLAPEVERMYAHELSGGMARRVLLCIALMDEPELIIADEPTPGIQDELAQQAMADLRDIVDSGRSVLLITHDIALACEHADRMVIFADGRSIEEVPAEAFASPDMLDDGFSKALWHAMPEHGLHESMEQERRVSSC